MPTPVKSDLPAGRFSLGLGHSIFAGVFALRLSTLLGLTHSALLLPSRGDMHFYNDWARDILQGQFTQPLAFYGLPGYAYLLAFLYKLFGDNPFVPGLIQAGVDAGMSPPPPPLIVTEDQIGEIFEKVKKVIQQVH